MGDQDAIAKLEGAEPPVALLYLDEWATDLASGLPDGWRWSEAREWARAKRLDPLPHEYDALRTLIAIMQNPELTEEAE
jgi:hypothetical protein